LDSLSDPFRGYPDLDLLDEQLPPDLPYLTNPCSMNSTISSADSQSVPTSYPSSVATVDWSSVPSHASISDQRSHNKRTLMGMLCVAVGTALFCSVGAMVQDHGGSVLQLMFGRYLIQNLISWLFWLANPLQIRGADQKWYGDAEHRKNIWARGFCLFLTVFFWWRGLEMVPLGDGEAILFLNPIVTVIAARLILGEELPTTFAVTTLLSVASLTLICQPSFLHRLASEVPDMPHIDSAPAPLSWQGVVCLIASVLAWSAACLLVRSAKAAHWLQLEMAATTQSILIWCPLLTVLSRYIVPELSDSERGAPQWLSSLSISGGDWDFSVRTFAMVSGMGVLGFLALMLNVVGYQLGEATRVAWFEYLDLVFAFLFQWLYFAQTPNLWEVAGCAGLLSACAVNAAEEYWRFRRSARIAKGAREEVLKGDADCDTIDRIFKDVDDIVDMRYVNEMEVDVDERAPLLNLVLPSSRWE